MHAACIWGQRFAGVVPFPVGFDGRRVHVPTRPGESYWAHVLPVKDAGGVLTLDLRLYDREGRLCEACAGLRMRDVSGGRLRPPDWVRGDGEEAAAGRLAGRCRAMAVIELSALAPFAERALSEPEHARLAGMRGRRRTSYIAARLACKRLARRLSGDDVRTPAEAITTIRSDRPLLPACPRTDGRAAQPCSVAHDRRFAVAVAADGPVGVDVETLSERVLKSRSLYMSAAEEALVRASPLGEVAAALRVWSVKEAVTKALDIAARGGLAAGPGDRGRAVREPPSFRRPGGTAGGARPGGRAPVHVWWGEGQGSLGLLGSLSRGKPESLHCSGPFFRTRRTL